MFMGDQIIIEKDVPAVMRDGTVLYANIYRPAELENKLPVLLSRLPYNKDHPHFSHRYIDPVRFVSAGYIVVIQDVRGRYASEGEFTPFLQEFEDGYDTVEWSADLPGADGNVGMFGLSYYGFTQIFAALMNPPSLKAAAPAFTGHNITETMMQRGGALQTAKLQTWLLESIAPDMLRREQAPPEEQQKLWDEIDHLVRDYSFRPLLEWGPFAERKSAVSDLYKSMLDGSLTKKLEEYIPADLNDLGIPGLHIGGWYDCFLQPTLDNYSAMKKGGAPQQLIIGPWGHGVMNPHLGDRHFGIRASGEFIGGRGDLTSEHIHWFDYYLKGISREKTAPVKYFVMGDNVWKEAEAWPPSHIVQQKWYFHRDGTLDRDRPDESHRISYQYDPDDPVPTIGGATLFYQGLNTGPLEQRGTAARNDVLVFETEKLAYRLEVTGRITVTLFASTTGVETDFTAKLTDVDESGKSIIVTEGIVRVLPEESCAEESWFSCNIDLWSTSNVFLPGHRMRIEISSSNFPKYAVNLNTGCTVIDSAKARKAEQTIFTGGNTPSYITLPIADDCFDA
ncbi:MAG: CocE/NonD family hydrolase [Alkalicoccus sp.]|nr:MAG: CocE/NonD family hydrolase [Alkalicoccus sp.]